MAVVEKSSEENCQIQGDSNRPWAHYKFGIILNIIGLIILTLIIIGILILFHVAKCVCPSEVHRRVHQKVNNEMILRIVTRNEWLARPPENALVNLQLPVDQVIIGETQTKSCSVESQCVLVVQDVQNFHMDAKYFADIAYNFLIGGDGYVYAGRGWDKQGAHTRGYNADSIGISFIGKFNQHSPPKRQFVALKLLLAEGVRQGKLSNVYKMYLQRELVPTDSPGDKIVDEIMHWDHFVDHKYDNVMPLSD